MVIIFQLINFTYLDLFKDRRFEGFSELGHIAYIEDCIKEYNRVNFLGTIMSSALVFHLFENYKVAVILEEIWQGKFTFECDGEIRDLSLLTHLATSPIKKLRSQRTNFNDLIFNGFSY